MFLRSWTDEGDQGSLLILGYGAGKRPRSIRSRPAVRPVSKRYGESWGSCNGEERVDPSCQATEDEGYVINLGSLLSLQPWVFRKGEGIVNLDQAYGGPSVPELFQTTQPTPSQASNEDPYAQEFGIKSSERLASDEAPILPPPSVVASQDWPEAYEEFMQMADTEVALNRAMVRKKRSSDGEGSENGEPSNSSGQGGPQSPAGRGSIPRHQGGGGGGGGGRGWSPANPRRPQQGRGINWLPNPLGVVTGETPRYSPRLGGKAKAPVTPEVERPKKQEKKSSSKKAGKENSVDEVPEAKEEDAAATESKADADVEMKEADEGFTDKNKEEPAAAGATVNEIAIEQDSMKEKAAIAEATANEEGAIGQDLLKEEAAIADATTNEEVAIGQDLPKEEAVIEKAKVDWGAMEEDPTKEEVVAAKVINEGAVERALKSSEILASVEARILPPPWLKYHDSGKEKDCLPRVGQWNMMNKVGGRNIVLVRDRPTIIFGADVTHPHLGEDTSPSIAAVVASHDWPEAYEEFLQMSDTEPALNRAMVRKKRSGDGEGSENEEPSNSSGLGGPQSPGGGGEGGGGRGWSPANPRRPQQGRGIKRLPNPLGVLTGETPRCSSRLLGGKAKATVTPEGERPTKKEKKSSSKKATKENSVDEVPEAKEGNAAATESKADADADVEMKETDEGFTDKNIEEPAAVGATVNEIAIEQDSMKEEAVAAEATENEGAIGQDLQKEVVADAEATLNESAMDQDQKKEEAVIAEATANEESAREHDQKKEVAASADATANVEGVAAEATENEGAIGQDLLKEVAVIEKAKVDEAVAAKDTCQGAMEEDPTKEEVVVAAEATANEESAMEQDQKKEVAASADATANEESAAAEATENEGAIRQDLLKEEAVIEKAKVDEAVAAKDTCEGAMEEDPTKEEVVAAKVINEGAVDQDPKTKTKECVGKNEVEEESAKADLVVLVPEKQEEAVKQTLEDSEMLPPSSDPKEESLDEKDIKDGGDIPRGGMTFQQQQRVEEQIKELERELELSQNKYAASPPSSKLLLGVLEFNQRRKKERIKELKKTLQGLGGLQHQGGPPPKYQGQSGPLPRGEMPSQPSVDQSSSRWTQGRGGPQQQGRQHLEYQGRGGPLQPRGGMSPPQYYGGRARDGGSMAGRRSPSAGQSWPTWNQGRGGLQPRDGMPPRHYYGEHMGGESMVGCRDPSWSTWNQGRGGPQPRGRRDPFAGQSWSRWNQGRGGLQEQGGPPPEYQGRSGHPPRGGGMPRGGKPRGGMPRYW